MGFPSVCYCVILPQPLVLVLQLLDLFRHAVLLTLSSLGLAAAPPDDHYHHPAAALPAPPPPPTTDLLLRAPHALLLLPPPAASVKDLLPAVRYADLLRRSAVVDSSVCAVCLGALQPRHRVRELANCAHAFHKACIDKWVDKGHVTCPLCRAALLPGHADDLASSSF